jgi:hypothetical protein
MIRLALVCLVSLSGCFIVFPEHGNGGDDDDDCLLPPAGGGTEPGGGREPSAIAPLRNPNTLTCDDFGGGGECRPECGPCPLGIEDQALAPIPSWGTCFSSCENLDETTCGARTDCRVVKDAFCAVQGDCFTDFLGCFPTDNFIDESVDCASAFDGETCSRNPACTAFHRQEACPLKPEDPAPPQCQRDFAFCMPEGVSPGVCNAPVACDSAGPNCPSGTTAGIAEGCFTGACIPLDLCELAPNQ